MSSIGEGGNLVDRGDNTYGGKWVVNPSGGLISKGHPLGATGNNAQRVHILFIISWHKCEWLVIDLNERLYSLNLVASAINDCLATVFFIFLYTVCFSDLDWLMSVWISWYSKFNNLYF